MDSNRFVGTLILPLIVLSFIWTLLKGSHVEEKYSLIFIGIVSLLLSIWNLLIINNWHKELIAQSTNIEILNIGIGIYFIGLASIILLVVALFHPID
jgi:hypothetical protein